MEQQGKGILQVQKEKESANIERFRDEYRGETKERCSKLMQLHKSNVANMEDRNFGRFTDIMENDAAINFTHDNHNADAYLEEQSGAINDPWTQSNLGYMEQSEQSGKPLDLSISKVERNYVEDREGTGLSGIEESIEDTNWSHLPRGMKLLAALVDSPKKAIAVSLKICSPVPVTQAITKEETNKNERLLQPIQISSPAFKWRNDAKLKDYLMEKTGTRWEVFTLNEIFDTLTEIINKEHLFDKKNTEIIICNQHLDRALGFAALHVGEIWHVVLPQLEKIPDVYRREHHVHHNRSIPTDIGSECRIDSEFPPTLRQTASIKETILTYGNKRFFVKPRLLEVFRTLPGVDLMRETFTYKEITDLLSSYIFERRTAFLDPRHNRLAIIENDPLSTAFGGIKAFHKCQTNQFLRNHIRMTAGSPINFN